MFEPRKAAFFLNFVCTGTRLPFPDRDVQGMSEVLHSTDDELRKEIEKYNAQASAAMQINVTPDFLQGLRTATSKIMEKQHAHNF